MIRAALRRATIGNKMVPVTCGTSYKNKGVQKLLDAIVDYMPVPAGHTRHQRHQPEDRRGRDARPVRRRRSVLPRWPSRSLTDPYVGKLCVLPRVLRYR